VLRGLTRRKGPSMTDLARFTDGSIAGRQAALPVEVTVRGGIWS
jgi:hypothetical protein